MEINTVNDNDDNYERSEDVWEAFFQSKCIPLIENAYGMNWQDKFPDGLSAYISSQQALAQASLQQASSKPEQAATIAPQSNCAKGADDKVLYRPPYFSSGSLFQQGISSTHDKLATITQDHDQLDVGRRARNVRGRPNDKESSTLQQGQAQLSIATLSAHHIVSPKSQQAVKDSSTPTPGLQNPFNAESSPISVNSEAIPSCSNVNQIPFKFSATQNSTQADSRRRLRYDGQLPASTPDQRMECAKPIHVVARPISVCTTPSRCSTASQCGTPVVDRAPLGNVIPSDEGVKSKDAGGTPRRSRLDSSSDHLRSSPCPTTKSQACSRCGCTSVSPRSMINYSQAGRCKGNEKAAQPAVAPLAIPNPQGKSGFGSAVIQNQAVSNLLKGAQSNPISACGQQVNVDQPRDMIDQPRSLISTNLIPNVCVSQQQLQVQTYRDIPITEGQMLPFMQAAQQHIGSQPGISMGHGCGVDKQAAGIFRPRIPTLAPTLFLGDQQDDWASLWYQFSTAPFGLSLQSIVGSHTSGQLTDLANTVSSSLQSSLKGGIPKQGSDVKLANNGGNFSSQTVGYSAPNVLYEQLSVPVQNGQTTISTQKQTQKQESDLRPCVDQVAGTCDPQKLSSALHMVKVGRLGESPLHIAVASNRFSVMVQLLNFGIDPRQVVQHSSDPIHDATKKLIDFDSNKDSYFVRCIKSNIRAPVGDVSFWHCTPLHISCYYGRTNIVTSLIDTYNVDLLDRNQQGYTALHIAVFMGYMEVAQAILSRAKEMKKIVDAVDNYGRTPLHMAARYGHVELLNRLWSCGCYLEATDNNGWTALHVAAYYGHLSIVHNLIIAGCTPANVILDKEGWGPAHIAAFQGHADILVRLLQAGYDIDTPSGRSKDLNLGLMTALHVGAGMGYLKFTKKCLEQYANLRRKDGSGQIPLHLAAQSGNADVVRLLLGAMNYQCDDQDANNASVLHYLVTGCDVALLAEVDTCFSLTEATKTLTAARQTPLHYVVFNQTSQASAVTKFLLSYGCDPFAVDIDGNTAAHLAASMGNNPVLKELHNFGVDVDIQSTIGCTCLHYAVQHCQEETLEYLISLNADDACADDRGRTCLHLACLNGGLSMVQTLLQHGKSKEQINATCFLGYTSLHYAAQGNHVQIIQELINNGASCDVVDNHGNTALHSAMLMRAVGAAKLLMSYVCQAEQGNNAGTTPAQLAALIGDQYLFQLAYNKAGQQCISHTDEKGQQILHYAMEGGNTQIIEQLFLHGALKYDDLLAKTGRNNVLHLACKHGHCELLSFLLNHKYDVNGTGEHKRTPLHLVCCGNNKPGQRQDLDHRRRHDMVVKLLERNASPHAVDQDGVNALMLAAGSGNLRTVSHLVCLCVNKHAVDVRHWSAMHHAAYRGHHDVVIYLYGVGCSLNSRAVDNRTPLHLASEQGHLAVVLTLMDQLKQDGKDLSKELMIQDDLGCVPVQLAAAGNHLVIVKKLLEATQAYGVDMKGLTTLHLAADSGLAQLSIDAQDLNATDANGKTPLFYAASRGHAATVKQLLQHGAIVDAQDNVDGDTALHQASSFGHTECVKALLDAGAQPTPVNTQGYNAMHVAASAGHVEVVRALLDKWGIEQCCTSNLSPLQCAAGTGQLEVVKLLLERGAVVDHADATNPTALGLSAAHGHLEVVKELLYHKADVNHQAVSGQHESVLDYLLGCRADPDALNAQQNTGLHIAAQKGCINIIDKLLDSGADVNIRNSRQHTCAHVAATNGHLDAMLTLITSGCKCREKGENDVAKLFIKKIPSSKLSYIEGRIKLAERGRKAGVNKNAPSILSVMTKKDEEEDLKQQEKMADAQMNALVEELEAEDKKAAEEAERRREVNKKKKAKKKKGKGKEDEPKMQEDSKESITAGENKDSLEQSEQDGRGSIKQGGKAKDQNEVSGRDSSDPIGPNIVTSEADKQKKSQKKLNKDDSALSMKKPQKATSIIDDGAADGLKGSSQSNSLQPTNNQSEVNGESKNDSKAVDHSKKQSKQRTDVEEALQEAKNVVEQTRNASRRKPKDSNKDNIKRSVAMVEHTVSAAAEAVANLTLESRTVAKQVEPNQANFADFQEAKSKRKLSARQLNQHDESTDDFGTPENNRDVWHNASQSGTKLHVIPNDKPAYGSNAPNRAAQVSSPMKRQAANVPNKKLQNSAESWPKVSGSKVKESVTQPSSSATTRPAVNIVNRQTTSSKVTILRKVEKQAGPPSAAAPTSPKGGQSMAQVLSKLNKLEMTDENFPPLGWVQGNENKSSGTQMQGAIEVAQPVNSDQNQAINSEYATNVVQDGSAPHTIARQGKQPVNAIKEGDSSQVYTQPTQLPAVKVDASQLKPETTKGDLQRGLAPANYSVPLSISQAQAFQDANSQYAQVHSGGLIDNLGLLQDPASDKAEFLQDKKINVNGTWQNNQSESMQNKPFQLSDHKGGMSWGSQQAVSNLLFSQSYDETTPQRQVRQFTSATDAENVQQNQASIQYLATSLGVNATGTAQVSSNLEGQFGQGNVAQQSQSNTRALSQMHSEETVEDIIRDISGLGGYSGVSSSKQSALPGPMSHINSSADDIASKLGRSLIGALDSCGETSSAASVAQLGHKKSGFDTCLGVSHIGMHTTSAGTIDPVMLQNEQLNALQINQSNKFDAQSMHQSNTDGQSKQLLNNLNNYNNMRTAQAHLQSYLQQRRQNNSINQLLLNENSFGQLQNKLGQRTLDGTGANVYRGNNMGTAQNLAPKQIQQRDFQQWNMGSGVMQQAVNSGTVDMRVLGSRRDASSGAESLVPDWGSSGWGGGVMPNNTLQMQKQLQATRNGASRGVQARPVQTAIQNMIARGMHADVDSMSAQLGHGVPGATGGFGSGLTASRVQELGQSGQYGLNMHQPGQYNVRQQVDKELWQHAALAAMSAPQQQPSIQKRGYNGVQDEFDSNGLKPGSNSEGLQTGHL